MPEERTKREAVLEAGLVLASELSLPAVLQRIVELACRASGARYGALGVLGSDGRIAEFLTHGISEAQRATIGRLPEGKGVLGTLISEGRPLRLRRIQDDPHSAGFPPNHPPMTSFLGVPVAVRGRVFGNLYLTEKQGAPEFSAEDEESVVALAAQAGVAVEQARLRDELGRLAILEERERIATDLHDDIVQSLFAEGMALQAARSYAGDAGAIDTRLAAAVENIDRVIRDLRNYVFGLRPGGMADVHLERALRDLAASFSEGGAPVEVRLDVKAAALLAGRATEIVQAAREALSNAVRHSGARRIELALEVTPEGIAIAVADDGSGFEPEAAGGRGSGLRNLHKRAAALGGTFEVRSAPGKGTVARIVVPV